MGLDSTCGVGGGWVETSANEGAAVWLASGEQGGGNRELDGRRGKSSFLSTKVSPLLPAVSTILLIQQTKMEPQSGGHTEILKQLKTGHFNERKHSREEKIAHTKIFLKKIAMGVCPVTHRMYATLEYAERSFAERKRVSSPFLIHSQKAIAWVRYIMCVCPIAHIREGRGPSGALQYLRSQFWENSMTRVFGTTVTERELRVC